MTPRRIAANALSLLLAYVLPRGLTFVAVVLAARQLGTRDFGWFGTATSFAVIFSILASLGMMPLLIREIARRPDSAPSLLRSAQFIKIVASLVMLVLLPTISGVLLYYPGAVVIAILLLGITHAIGALCENFSAYFQAVERMHVWTQASTIGGVVAAAAGILAVVTTASLVWFCAAFVAGQAATLAWLWWQAPATIGHFRPVRRRDITAMLGTLRPFVVSALVVAAYYKIDVLLLTALRPAHDVGLYTAGRKFLDLSHALILVAIGAVYPRLARGGPGRSTASALLLNVAWLIGVPVAVFLLLLRDHAVLLLYGEAYRAAITPLGLMALAIPAMAINLLGSYLLATGERVGMVAALYAAGLAMNVAMNAMLIPLLGRTGAAAAFVISEALVAAGFLAVLKKTFDASLTVRSVVAALGVGIIALLADTGIPGPPPFPTTLVIVVIVGAWYWVVGVFRSPHMVAVKDALRTVLGIGAAPRAEGA